MKDLIDQLSIFSKKNFPVPEVSKYFKSYNFKKEDCDKYTFFEDNCYTRNLVYRNKDFEILVLCWAKGQTAPIHGHEGEKCWAKVEQGSLQFCNYTIKSHSPLIINKNENIIGHSGYLDGPAELHSVENIFDKSAISLHIYAKPFDECDIYNIDNQSVQRVKLEYHSKFGELC